MRVTNRFLPQWSHLIVCLIGWLPGVLLSIATHAQPTQVRKAPAPLFRDPIYDGAADPVLIWNRAERAWWMLYTARRANVPTQDVSAYFGNRVGIASSADHGQSWTFRGYLDLEFERGMNTFWAPDVVYENGTYHMFVVYIQGVRNHWGGKKRIVHYTSPNLWDWKLEAPLTLSSEQVIDATILKKPDGTYRMWYKDDARGGITMTAESPDLYRWTANPKPAVGGRAHEGPKVFAYQGHYWMLTDEWRGLRVHRSKDLETWETQGLILDGPSEREDDRPSGAHADVVVFGDRAYIVYFTHPGRESHTKTRPDPDGTLFHANHRTAIQVAPLQVVNGTLAADRSKPFDFWLPDGK